MPATCRALRRYLRIALVLFFLGAAALDTVAFFSPLWLEQFGTLPAPWPRLLNALMGGMIAGGLYTGGVWVTRHTEEHGSNGVASLFNKNAYVMYLLLGPLLFFPAIAIALRRLLSGSLPEDAQERIVRRELPRQ